MIGRTHTPADVFYGLSEPQQRALHLISGHRMVIDERSGGANTDPRNPKRRVHRRTLASLTAQGFVRMSPFYEGELELTDYGRLITPGGRKP